MPGTKNTTPKNKKVTKKKSPVDPEAARKKREEQEIARKKRLEEEKAKKKQEEELREKQKKEIRNANKPFGMVERNQKKILSGEKNG